MKAYLIYDLEILRAIPGKEARVEGVEYCAGWNDHANMGVSVLCAYSSRSRRYHTFLDDNMQEFFGMFEDHDLFVTFNGLSFDNRVLQATYSPASLGDLSAHYDILVELWAAAGLGPAFNFKTHGGFGLDATCAANFGTRKSGTGAYAPVDWQVGRRGKVIDYCLNDVALTRQAFERILQVGGLRDPRNPQAFLPMRHPAG